LADEPQVYEKLGAFYLGKEFDIEGRKLLDNLVMYDSKDLVTHTVIVGMTGSGKTGLEWDSSRRRPSMVYQRW